MANLKHHFRRGRMNKDLDERLLPNGEYRDAQNVEIITSEGSDVGSVQNVLGTVLKRGRTYDENTQVLTEWSADSNLFDLINPTCIGSFVDTRNDNIYWFIHYSFLNTAGDAITNGSAVVEYEHSTGIIQPILVDVNNILNFSSNFLITSINVIDGLLFFTDNQTEPKRINIKKFKEGTTVGSDQFKVQTKYLGSSGNDFTENDITVIKLSPTKKPELSLSASQRTGAGTSIEPINLTSTSVSFKTSDDADGVSIATGSDLTLNFPNAPNYIKKDILKLSFTESDSIEGDVVYEIIVRVAEKVNDKSIKVKINVIPDDVPFGTNLPWEVVLVEDEPLFEFKFVRFAYRYKYIDGEYSTFSPFSNIAFLPSNFEYKSSDGFNVGMTNTARKIEIQTLETPPVGVIEVDLLYKETNDNNVYVVDRIKTEDLSTEFPYQIKSEIVGDVIESNQILRSFDNVPIKAQAQEISGSRVLYGNYTEGYDIENDRLPDIETTHVSADITTVGSPEKSIKTQRTYQVGVVYLDAFGRETPVFSKKEAAITLPKQHADKVNSLSCKLLNNAPTFATHFKYFVKETSSEYYNLALDRFYLAEDGNIWLSFPSSERNKVTEEDYLILKKEHDKSVFVGVDDSKPNPSARYKVLDIRNNVPDFIATELKSIAVATVECRVSGSALLNEPVINGISFQFLGPTDALNTSFYNAFTSDSEIVITTTNGSTRRYKLEKGGPTGKQELSQEIYDITLRESIKETDEDIFISSSTSALIDGSNNAIDIEIEVLKKEKVEKAQFFGRFFLKINRDEIFDEKIIQTFPSATTEFVKVRNVNVKQFSESDVNDEKKNGITDFCWTDTLPDGRFSLDTPGHPKQGKNEFILHLAGLNVGSGKLDKNSLYENVLTTPFSTSITTNGTFIQFENKNGDKGSIYKILNTNVTTEFRGEKSRRKRISGRRRNFEITIEKVTNDITNKGKEYDDSFDYNIDATDNKRSRITKINVMRRLVSTNFLDEDDISSNDPAIFEVEPKETVDLDIYNEVGSAIPILKTGLKVTGTNIPANSVINFYDPIGNTIILDNNTTDAISSGTVLTFTDPKGIYSFTLTTTGTISSGIANITIADGQVHGQIHNLDWCNCYSFGQGVESNRIRDDFNAVTIDKGPIVSTVLNEKYKRVIKSNTIIYSGIFNSTGGVNRLNEFIAAEKITKDLNPIYGSIQKLHTRDADLIAFCEDKVINILANKDALFNADGDVNLTSTNKVLGQAMPYAGEYGISKNPESFVSHAYRVYFADKARGSVLRLSKDGLTDIAMKGMTDFFNDNLPLSTSIIGSYDERKGSYNITLNNLTVCFNERVDGWTTFKSYIPESGVSLNNTYYTYKNGYLYAHTNERRNSFYQVLAKTAATLTNSTSLSIATQPGVDNIAVGDFVLGTGIVGDVTVSSISVPTTTVGGVTIPNRSVNTTVTLSSNQTIANSTNLEFIKTSDTSVTLLINDEPSTIKEYKTLNYEGSDSKSFTYSGTISVDASGSSLSPNVTIPSGTTLDVLNKSNYNSNQIAQLTESSEAGWFADSITTNAQSGDVKFFKNKEGLWSNIILGDNTILSNIDTKELSVQGLGSFSSITGATSPTQAELTIALSSSDTNIDFTEATSVIRGIANGTDLSSNPGTLALTIKPKTGFTLTASDLSLDTGVSVSSISFSQDGVNVIATLTLSGTMPSSDATRTTTISGLAVAKNYTVAGTFDTIEENTTSLGSSDDVAYSGSGIYNTTAATVLTKTFVASDNHFFNIKPTAFIEEEDASAISSYDITDDWATTTATVNGAVTSSIEVNLDGGHTGIVNGMAVTGVGLGQNARVHSIGGNTLILTSAKTIPDGTTLTFTSTSVTFTVKYVFGINNPTTDKLVFTAKAVEVFDPNIVELTSFVSGNKTILSQGGDRTMVIQGSTGYDAETNPTFTFSNEAEGSGTITFNQPGSSGTAATISFTIYVGSVQPGMGVSGTNIPDNTVVNYVEVNPTTDAITIHLTLGSGSAASTPTGTITFKEFYNSSTQAYQAASSTITLPDTGRLSITRSYNPVTATKYYRYFIRAVAPADLSSSFSGSATLDSSNDFALCEVTQYAKATINISATSNIVDSASTAINIRNLPDTVTVSSATADSKTITLSSSDSNVLIQPGMVVTGTNILAKTRVESISGTTLVIDQTPTTAPSGELKFLDNGQFDAYGEPEPVEPFGLIPFTVTASVGGTTTLTQQRDISAEDDFEYNEITLVAAAVVSGNVGFSSGAVPDSLAVGSIITSDRITANHSDKVITVGAIPSTSAITLAVDGVTLSSNASLYVTTGDELVFSAPYGWDFTITNLSEAITGSNKYTLTGQISVARYGNQSLTVGLNLNNIIARANSGSGGATTTTIPISTISSTDYYISNIIMYPKQVAVGTATSENIGFSGTVIGNWAGNTVSGIKLYLGPGTTGFKNDSGGTLVTGSGTSADVLVSLTSTLTTANQSPTVTQATFSFTLRLSATAAAGQSLIVEPRIFLPDQYQ